MRFEDEVLRFVDSSLKTLSPDCRLIYARKEVVEEPKPGPLVSEVDMDERLKQALLSRGVERLYEFQHQAYQKIVSGSDVMIVSGTATGKTEAFIVPVMELLLRKKLSRALVVYPTKALARDQLTRFRMLAFSLGISVDVFDGDTSLKERRKIAESPPHILITNPDMIHFGLMQSKHFRSALAGVERVVLDEVHVYEGAFGSHVYRILRRLESMLGDVQLIGCGATVGNPEELGKLLFDREVEVVRGTPSKKGVATHVLASAGHLSRWTVSARLIAALARAELRTLAFVDSQQMAEVLARIASRQGCEALVHRAGLQRSERERVEDALRRGSVEAVVSTPTLELGIDIGFLDAIVLAQPPPSYTKYLQRAGRAGRRNRPGYVFTVLGDDPIDAYYERNPKDFFEQELTPVVFEPKNEEILRVHVLARVAEARRLRRSALSQEEEAQIPYLVSEELVEERGPWLIVTRRGWALLRERGLRGAGPEVAIFCAGEQIGRRELPEALHDLHPGAIYLHQRKAYEVELLDLEKRVAVVHRIRDDVAIYTRPLFEVDLGAWSQVDQRVADGVPVAYGEADITKTVIGYNVYSVFGEERVPVQTVLLPEPVSWSYRTKAILARYARWVDIDAIHALEHVVIHAARPVVGAGLSDLGGISYPSGHVVIYDATPGGSGLSRLLFEKLERAHKLAYDIVSSCDCEDGCPRCVYDPFCGNNNRHLSRKGAVELFEKVFRGEGVPKSLEEPFGESRALSYRDHFLLP